MRRQPILLAAFCLFASLAACSGSETDVAPTTTAASTTTVESQTDGTGSDLVFATVDGLTLTLDMHVPDEPAGAPIVFNGWAIDELVEQGVIVATIDDFEPPAWLEGGPGSLGVDHGASFRAHAEINACAIHFARAWASALGNEDPILALTDFSMAGGMAAHVALFGATLEARWDEFAAAGGPERRVECEVADSSTHVDAIVGVAGAYDVLVPIYDGKWGLAYQQEVDPELQEFLASAIGANPDLKVRLLHGTADTGIPPENSVEFQAMLANAGYDVQFATFVGGHDVPPTDLFLSTVMEALGR